MDLSRATLHEIEAELVKRMNCQSMPQKNIILLGPPGSGKGTQSNKIMTDFCYCQLSTGDLLREHVLKKTPEGIKAQEAMDQGKLVGDEIVNSIILNKVKSNECSRGIIFDGYPRNAEQAENLVKLLEKEGKKLDQVIELKINEEELYDRIDGRRVHTNSGRSYHVKFNPPKIEGKDDLTGEDLIHRKDDKREVVKERIDIYNSKTLPVSTYYASKGLLKSVDAMKPIDNIYENIKNILI